MDAMTKSRTTHRSLFAVMASILACFALVMSLVPAQAMADQDTQGTETATETSGGDDGIVTLADDEGVELIPIDISTLKGDDNLIYTGKQQLLLKADKSILVDISNSETPPVWDEDKKDTTGQTGTYYGTNAGKYTFTVTPRTGYKWLGGGHEPVDVTFEITPAEIDKATIITLPSAVVFDNEPAVPEVTIKTAEGKTLTANTDYKLEYKNNEDKGTGTVYITGLNNYTGLTHKNFKIVDRQGIFRLYNPNSGEHFFTTSKAEHDHLVSVGWKTEGISWYAPTESAAPVYRLYNPNAGDHHYTTSKAEYDHLGKVGWQQEGTAFYSDEEAKTPVLRAYNPNAKAGAHHFTTSEAEKKNLVVAGWKDEGIGWYASSVKN